MKPAAVHLAIAAVLIGPGAGAGQTETARLELGSPVATEIAAGDTHTYKVSVEANEALHLVARQLGADVVITLLEAAGTPIVEMDTPTGTDGAESIWFVAPASGELLVHVRTFEGYGGEYELELETLRDATPEDIERMRLQTLFLEAASLAAQEATEAQQTALGKLKEAAAVARGLGDPEASALAVRLLWDLDVGAGLENLGLPVLPGPVPAYYSPGYEARAAALRDGLVRAIDFFEQRLGVAPKIYLAVLDQKHWTSACFASAPYGMPQARGSRSGSGLVCLGATFELFDELSRNLKANLSEADLEAIETATGAPFEENMREFGDTIMYHELGHLYTGAYGITVPNAWVNELLANFLATAYESENPLDPQVEEFRSMMNQALDRAPIPHTSLEDFERLYVRMEVPNFAWYQHQLTRRAAEVYEAEGLEFLEEVKAAFPPEEERPIPVQVSLERMERISPGFLERC